MTQYGRFIAVSGAILLWSHCANGSGKAVAQVQPFDRFADWCENRAELTEAARHTVEKLLEEVETLDCQIA
ncbi:MAG: leucine-rich repeat domain-containing protein, partial [Cyanobacteriota bacterium]|nr:leucine-rich repeat domain-containing protein [Cyanobacteriota bacterium]